MVAIGAIRLDFAGPVPPPEGIRANSDRVRSLADRHALWHRCLASHINVEDWLQFPCGRGDFVVATAIMRQWRWDWPTRLSWTSTGKPAPGAGWHPGLAAHTLCAMTDAEIRELLLKIPAISGWPRDQQAWLRDRVEEAGVDLAEVDSWVKRSGGSVEDHKPGRTLGPYYGQQPVPVQTLYVIPRSVFDDVTPA